MDFETDNARSSLIKSQHCPSPSSLSYKNIFGSNSKLKSNLNLQISNQSLLSNKYKRYSSSSSFSKFLNDLRSSSYSSSKYADPQVDSYVLYEGDETTRHSSRTSGGGGGGVAAFPVSALRSQGFPNCTTFIGERFLEEMTANKEAQKDYHPHPLFSFSSQDIQQNELCSDRDSDRLSPIPFLSSRNLYELSPSSSSFVISGLFSHPDDKKENPAGVIMCVLLKMVFCILVFFVCLV